MSRRVKEDLEAVVSWLLIVFVLWLGASLSFSREWDDLGARTAGALLLTLGTAALGLWWRWCTRIAIRDESYSCDCPTCVEHRRNRPTGKHHA